MGGGVLFYAEPSTKAVTPSPVNREQTACPRREMNSGQQTFTVLVTGDNRRATRTPKKQDKQEEEGEGKEEDEEGGEEEDEQEKKGGK